MWLLNSHTFWLSLKRVDDLTFYIHVIIVGYHIYFSYKINLFLYLKLLRKRFCIFILIYYISLKTSQMNFYSLVLLLLICLYIYIHRKILVIICPLSILKKLPLTSNIKLCASHSYTKSLIETRKCDNVFRATITQQRCTSIIW